MLANRSRRMPLTVERLETRLLLSASGQRFVTGLYPDLLGRPVDPSGLAFWSGRLDQGVGPAQVALGIEGSPEFQAVTVRDLYTSLFRRPVDPTGLAGWTGFLASGGTGDQLKARLLGSDEYFQHQGSGNNAGFLAVIFPDVLGRALDPSASAAYSRTLAAGTSRTAVAAGIVQGPEARRHLIQGWYERYLHRPADPQGLSFFVQAVQNGVTPEGVAAAIAGSDEYATRLSIPSPDTTAPTLTLTFPTAGAQLAGTAHLTGSAADAGSGIATAQFALDGGAFTALTLGGGGQFDQPLAVTPLTAGAHQVTVQILDAAGNSTRQTVAFTVLPANGNHPPVLATVGPLTTTAGQRLAVQLRATDADNDPVTFALSSTNALPTGGLDGAGRLVFTPTPAEVGTYDFLVTASDGKDQVSQPVTLRVTADPLTTTRLSGVIQNTSQQPLAGVALTVGAAQTTTAADGSFLFDFGANPPPDDRLKVHGEGLTGTAAYPFIAEKLALLLNHDVFTGVNNVIERPIFLPPLDIANGKKIDPNNDTTVTTAAIPGAAVFVAKGTLKDRQGNPFTGTLSITRVPTGLTPAALPADLHPDLVVTIQPGDMVFTQPAPLTMPNPGYTPGTSMDLWSINPTTGFFDKVGTGQVSADGATIQTVSGGIRNSSWHFFTNTPPAATAPKDNPKNHASVPPSADLASLLTIPTLSSVVSPFQVCKRPGSSDLDMHSGAVTETHDLPTYQSLGVARGLTLTYDSLRADARPIVHVGFGDVDPATYSVPSALRLVAKLSVSRGTFRYDVAGNAGGSQNLTGGENFWTIPSARGPVDAALQVDLRALPSGRYNYTLTSGVLGFSNGGGGYIGTSTESGGDVVLVNGLDGPFGSGWGIAGLQQLVVNPDGSVLLIDGGGTEEVFEAPATAGGPYVAPAGDFSTFERLPDGTFRRTLTDQTVYTFNAQNQLAQVRDRNGNATVFSYDAAGHLTKITDPVGLTTTFSYNAAGKVAVITDPAGRITQLAYDAAGNLAQVTDPDGSQNRWEYDAAHHQTAAVDKLGHRGQDFYDFAGRVTRSVLADGTGVKVSPAETLGLYPPGATSDPANAPAAVASVAATATYTDGAGHVIHEVLDQLGQEVSAFDDVGPLPTTKRDARDLVTQSADARGNKTDYTYDARGNLLTARDTPSTGSFTETGGQVVVEAEHFGARKAAADGHGWRVVPGEDAGVNPAVNFRGTGFLQVVPETGAFDGNPLADKAAYVDYKVHVTTTGVYQLYTRSASFDVGSDSFYARVLELHDGPGGAVADYYQYTIYNGQDLGASGAWRGTAGLETAGGYPGEQAATWNITAPGDYTLRFSMREDGAMLDAFVLQLQSLPAPTGQGPAESSTNGGSGTVQRSFTYDATFNQLTSVTDELGHQTLYQLDPANGNVLTITHVVGAVGGGDDQVIRTTYTAHGQIQTTTDPLGRVTRYDYDPLGRLTSTTFAAGTPDEGVRRFEYGAAGNVAARVDENTNRTEYTYDAMNGLVRVHNAAGKDTALTHDASGNLVKITDARGNVTRYEYDALGRQTKVVDPLAGQTLMTYDATGALLTATDPLGHVAQYAYDKRNRRTEVVDANGGHTKLLYDADNNLAGVTDSAGNQTTYVYDGRNRVVLETDPLGHSTQYAYDAADHLVSKTDRDGRQTTYAYDDLGRLVTQTWVGGSDVFRYTYDLADQLLSVTDTASALAYTYDNRGRVVTVDNNGTPDVPRVVLTYAYDAAGNTLSVADAIDGRAAGVTASTFDAMNRVTRITQGGAGVAPKRVDLTYNEIGQLSSLDRFTDPGGARFVAGSTYGYDALNRLAGLTHHNTTATVAFETLTYDAAGRIATVTDGDGTTRYSYDAAGEVVGAAHGSAANPDETYAYDANGNRTASPGHATGTRTGPGNRLASDGTFNYEYDNEGNLVRRTEIATGKVRELAWDFRNRLTSVTDKDAAGTVVQRVAFTYDALDRRVRKAVTQASGTTQTLYVSDGYDVILEFLDKDGAAGPNAPALDRRYLRGPMVDQLLAQEDAAGTVLWPLADHLMTVRDVVGSSGAVVDHVTYDTFGNVLAQSNPAASSRDLFTGREYDVETGYYYYRSRYYAPDQGRFLGEDALGLRADTNPFRYAGADPVNRSDPTGHIAPIVGYVAYTALGVFVIWVADALGEEGYGWATGESHGHQPFDVRVEINKVRLQVHQEMGFTRFTSGHACGNYADRFMDIWNKTKPGGYEAKAVDATLMGHTWVRLENTKTGQHIIVEQYLFKPDQPSSSPSPSPSPEPQAEGRGLPGYYRDVGLGKDE